MLASNGTASTAVVEIDEKLVIEYSRAVIEDLRRQAVEGFNAFGHGGLEIGGVLYGSCEAGRIHVLASAELASEHAHGPGFVLSENDRAALDKLLDPPPGFETVGWYRSHTRSGLTLDAHDRGLFDRFFSSRRSIGLLIKPTRWGPASGAFYVREAAGEIRPGDPCDFAIEPRTGRPEPVDDVAEPVALEEAAAAEPVPRRKRAWLPWASAVLALAALAAAGFYWLRPPPSLRLQAYEVAPGQVRIDWDRHSRAVAAGATGTIEISDGGSWVIIPLNGGQLRSSSVTYARHGTHIAVRLKVEWKRGAPVEESLDFVGPPAAPEQAPQTAGAAPAPPQDFVTLNRTPSPIPETAGAAPQPNTAKVQLTPEPERVVITIPVRRTFRGPAHQPASPAQPVSILSPPPIPGGVPRAPAGLPESMLKASAPAASAAKPSRTSAPVAHSGRMIWTGLLERRGVVEIAGDHSSIGTLSGSLPGVPVTIRVWPAEFTRAGLTIYTADGARNGRKEAAATWNGWNSTLFQFDAARAGQLVVLEAPNTANGFGRLAVRNDARTCAVMVVEWTAK